MTSAGSLGIVGSMGVLGLLIAACDPPTPLRYDPEVVRWGTVLDRRSCALAVQLDVQFSTSPCVVDGPMNEDLSDQREYRLAFPASRADLLWRLDTDDPVLDKPIVYVDVVEMEEWFSHAVLDGLPHSGFMLLTSVDMSDPPVLDGRRPFSMTCDGTPVESAYLPISALVTEDDLLALDMDVADARAAIAAHEPADQTGHCLDWTMIGGDGV